MFVRTESFKEFIRSYPLISLIVLINVLFYLLPLLSILPLNGIFEKMSGVNLSIAQGEWWRLITPIFLHAGFAHLLFNSFALIIFCPPLEQMLGKVRFLILYLSSGIIANLATFAFQPLTYIHVGSSGAIFGLFGMYIALIIFRRDLMSYNNKQVILTIVAISLVMTFIQPNINVTAHITGCIAGFFIGVLMLGKRKEFAQSVKRSVEHVHVERLTVKHWVWIGIAILVILGILGR